MISPLASIRFLVVFFHTPPDVRSGANAVCNYVVLVCHGTFYEYRPYKFKDERAENR